MTTPTQRTPKLGEVWTSNGQTYTCVDAVPDDLRRYGWLSHGRKQYTTVELLTPPKTEPHEWLAAVVVCVYKDRVIAYSNADLAERAAGPSVLLGTARLDESSWEVAKQRTASE